MYRSIAVPLDPSAKKPAILARRLAEAEPGAAVMGFRIDATSATDAALGRLAAGVGAQPLPATTEPPPADVPFATRTLSGRARVDTLVVKTEDAATADESDTILVCMDGSAQAFAGLMTALELAEAFDKKVEAVAVYDPYLHYTLFNGIVEVLTEEASSVFEFSDQVETPIQCTLLDGKAFQKLLRHAERSRPWLMVVGRIGVHSDADMDLGATTENLLRHVPCEWIGSSSGGSTPAISTRACTGTSR